MAGLPVLQKSSPFKSISDLSPISLVGRFTYAMFASKASGMHSVRDLSERLRQQPGKLSYATGSLGDYMSTTRYLNAINGTAVRVLYQGGVQLMPDLISGRIDFNLGPLSSGLALAREGRITLLAVLQAQHSLLAPDVPTLAEAGIANVSYAPWQGIYSSPGLPGSIASQLARIVAEAIAMKTVREGLEAQALQVEAGPPGTLKLAAEQDAIAWKEFVSEMSISPE
jgi:tripartite-type tricarboxylate transporter receptor subunit TctC